MSEEDAFRALFPAYHGEFDAEPPADGEALAPAPVAAAAAPVTVDDAEAVAGAFVGLFGEAGTGEEDDIEWSSFAHARADELAAQLGAVARALRELKG